MGLTREASRDSPSHHSGWLLRRVPAGWREDWFTSDNAYSRTQNRGRCTGYGLGHLLHHAGTVVMSRPRRIPARGDVSASTIADLLGLSAGEFAVRLPALHERKFPRPDPTTGLYCIEAVERWRFLRHPQLFPELTATPGPAHAGTVFDERMRQLNG
jgi:hypothetical protein